MIVAACMGNMKLKELTQGQPIEAYAINEYTGLNDSIKKTQDELKSSRQEVEKLKSIMEAFEREEQLKFEFARAKRIKDEKIIAAIANNLKGVFAGKAEYIFFSAKNFNVNPMLLAAIFSHETGCGTSYAVKKLNNPGGIMGNKGLISFRSLEEGIDYTSKLLKTNYIDKGLTSLSEIQKKYCPVGAANDPQKTNRYWLPVVSMKYQKILEEATS
jgi:hypothetical protein